MKGVIRDHEGEREEAIQMFREIINTKDTFSIDIHFHAEVGVPMKFEYEIKKAIRPIMKEWE